MQRAHACTGARIQLVGCSLEFEVQSAERAGATDVGTYIAQTATLLGAGVNKPAVAPVQGRQWMPACARRHCSSERDGMLA